MVSFEVFELGLFLFPTPQLCHSLENQQPENSENLAGWHPQRGQMGPDLFQSLIPRELSLFDRSGGSLEVPPCKAVFI